MRGLLHFAISILTASMLLPACAGMEKPPSPAQAVFMLSSQYNLLLGEIDAYESQPRCIPPAVVACSDPEVVEELRGFVAEANPLVAEAERVAREQPDNGNAISNAAGAARKALAVLEQYMIAEGVK